jgi:hypothetical protein
MMNKAFLKKNPDLVEKIRAINREQLRELKDKVNAKQKLKAKR